MAQMRHFIGLRDGTGWRTTPPLTCGQEAVGSQKQLGRHLHLGLALVFEGGEVALVLVVGHLLPVPVIGWTRDMVPLK